MKVKVYGQANDAIPEPEMITAMLIQTAGALGLKSCRDKNYEGKDGKWRGNADTAVACCAMGAAQLDRDLKDKGVRYLHFGNDNRDADDSYGDLPAYLNGYDIGAAFYHARRVR